MKAGRPYIRARPALLLSPPALRGAHLQHKGVCVLQGVAVGPHAGVAPSAALVIAGQIQGKGRHPVAHELTPPLRRQALQAQIDGEDRKFPTVKASSSSSVMQTS